MFKVPERKRLTHGPMGSTKADGNNGLFNITSVKFKRNFLCIASDGAGWEHVSVSLRDRCPTWEEMCYIKSVFWDTEDTVIQFHPPESEYVNNHPYCLHLWRKIGQEAELPPRELVGV